MQQLPLVLLRLATITRRFCFKPIAFAAVILAAAFVTFPLRAAPIQIGDTYAYAYLVNTSGQYCGQGGIGATSASCSFSGAMSRAVPENSNGGIASVSLGSTATAGYALTAYWFGLEGPANVNVPIIVSGSASTHDNQNALGASYAAYYIYANSTRGFTYLGDFFASPTACGYINSAGYPCHSSGNFSLNTSVQSDIAFYIWLAAYAGGTNASASIDPLITIDPSFPLANEFTVVSNADVFPPQPASTPEPTTFALIGVAAVLVLGKRVLRMFNRHWQSAD